MKRARERQLRSVSPGSSSRKSKGREGKLGRKLAYDGIIISDNNEVAIGVRGQREWKWKWVGEGTLQ